MLWAKKALFYYWGFTRPTQKRRHAYSTSPSQRGPDILEVLRRQRAESAATDAAAAEATAHAAAESAQASAALERLRLAESTCSCWCLAWGKYETLRIYICHNRTDF